MSATGIDIMEEHWYFCIDKLLIYGNLQRQCIAAFARSYYDFKKNLTAAIVGGK
ncbi:MULTISPECIES: hypothetical protein [unclassified Microcoleus]|uniref:hypothetical protein n=1 Tax=unclassified Microcoleus TaxID=2642155 RepID=UPI002FD6560D